MIEIIKNPAYDFLMTQVHSSHKHIAICTPDIDEKIIEQVMLQKNVNTSISLITSNNVAKYLFKKTNLNVLNQMLDRHFKIYNYQQLNANIYIFDHKYVWITSSHLTNKGLEDNFEYGLFTSESNIVHDVVKDYQTMVHSDACGKVEKKHISLIQKQIKHMNQQSVIIDMEGDYVLTKQNTDALTYKMSGWKKVILDSLRKDIDKDIFRLEDVYALENKFAKIYLDNHHIKDKIRQVLQFFRDAGYLKFVDNYGTYKKLWK